jgi:hypothetical protein
MLKLLILACSLFIASILPAQEEKWDVYMAQYEKGAGSTMLNMGLKQVAPVKDLPFVLVAGIKFTDCSAEGFPTEREFTRLYIISDSIKTHVDDVTKKNILAGTFTYQCERTDYYYVADTTRLRQELVSLITKQFPGYVPYINIKPDPQWEGYLHFLYPSETIQEYMSNQKVVMKLQEAGDKLEKPRKTDHWLYFKTKTDRDCFIKYAVLKKFKIEKKDTTGNAERPYLLQISRIDKIDLQNINPLTLELKKQAGLCKGEYDGWETFVVK